MTIKDIINFQSKIIDTNWKKEAQARIKAEEGCVLKVYKCTAGKNSVGYGHNLDANGISKSTAEFIFAEDFNIAVENAKVVIGISEFNVLPNQAKIVAVDMAFQLGKAGFSSFKKFVRALRESRWEDAIKELKNSKAYTQCPKRYKSHIALLQELV